ncbi:MAG: hypothetical protein AAGE37_11935 [Pseudomonadota bacterium]
MQPSNSTAPLQALRKDMSKHCADLSEELWEGFARQCREVNIRKRNEVFTDQPKPNDLLFVTRGICAAQLALSDGQVVISRFFEAGDLCAVVRFTHMGQHTENSIVAVTPVEGVIIPLEIWDSAQFEGGWLAPYTRHKMYRQHLFEIDMLHLKSVNRTDVSYEFLKERHPTVLQEAPQTVLAQFCGITPEGFSRFLRNYTGR